MKDAVLTLLPTLFSFLTPDVMVRVIDAILDIVEDAAEASENAWDDAIVLPLCVVIRNTCGIEDNDAVENANAEG